MNGKIRRVIKLGDSSVVSLPAAWAKEYGIERTRGEEPRFVVVTTVGDMMIVRPSTKEAAAASD